MKQIIPFVKDVSLNTKISEITSIALEHNLQMENSDSIVGSFIVSGKYKINEISISEEVFEKEIPFDITLDDKYDASKVQIDIDDFYYEIINEEFLRLHIDVMANNLVYYKEQRPIIVEEKVPDVIVPEVVLKKEEKEEVIENTLEEIKEDEEPIKQPEKVIEEMVTCSKENNDMERTEEILDNEVKNESRTEESCSLDANGDEETRIDVAKGFSSSLLSEKEEYVTYKVHIVRDDETIDMIKEKYSISKEELEKYNCLDNIVLGTKIIIPVKDE